MRLLIRSQLRWLKRRERDGESDRMAHLPLLCMCFSEHLGNRNWAAWCHWWLKYESERVSSSPLSSHPAPADRFTCGDDDGSDYTFLWGRTPVTGAAPHRWLTPPISSNQCKTKRQINEPRGVLITPPLTLGFYFQPSTLFIPLF